MRQLAAAIAVAVALVGHATTADAQVYRCDEGGRTVYSDKPCADPTRSVSVPIAPRASEEPSVNLQREASLGRVAVGMTPTQVESAWGKPRSINTTTSTSGRTDQWVYRRSSGNAYVYFRGGLVSSVSTHSGGDDPPPAPAAPAFVSQADREAAERAEAAGERRHVTEGLPAATVRGRLGEPEQRGWSGGAEWWTYGPTERDPQTRTTVWFRGGQVSKIERKVER